jgi:hypothetical protein
VIPQIDLEIDNRKYGINGNGNILQLQLIKEELLNIKMLIQTNSLPNKEERFTAFSRYVIDEWDLNSLLGEKLCEIADKYKRKI